MGTIAQEILRKMHKLPQREQVKKDVDAAQAKAEGSDKAGSKAGETIDKKGPAKDAVAADKRNLGDSPDDVKKAGEQPEKNGKM